MNKRLPVPKMEGTMARWYARQRGSAGQLAAYRDSARALTAHLPSDAAILEIAPGPGHHAVELARLGFSVSAVDISHSFVDLARTYAREQGVDVRVQQGDAASLPDPDGTFGLIVCQAAFKNFTEPVKALNEMHRVLQPGGVAVIEDMNHDVSAADIATEVERMGQGAKDAFFTRLALRGLRHRAYTADRFRKLASESSFGSADITAEGIGLTVRLTRA